MRCLWACSSWRARLLASLAASAASRSACSAFCALVRKKLLCLPFLRGAASSWLPSGSAPSGLSQLSAGCWLHGHREDDRQQVPPAEQSICTPGTGAGEGGTFYGCPSRCVVQTYLHMLLTLTCSNLTDQLN